MSTTASVLSRFDSMRMRFLTAAVVLATSIAVVSFQTGGPGNAVGTPEIRQLANTTDVNDASSPEEMVMLGDKMIFRAYRQDIGWELWSIDTASANSQPVLIADINPDGDSTPANLTVWNDKVIFRASDGTTGNELWITNGTTAGTILIKDINVGAGNSDPGSFKVAGTKVYFTANDGSSGHVMWVTDGTAQGTVAMSGIATRTQSSSPSSIVTVGNNRFYVADDGINGREIWITDGTDAGTRMVRDLNPGGGQGADQIYGVIANGVAFRGYTSTTGWELFFTDGTIPGTVLLKDLVAGSPDSSIDLVTVAAGKMFFRASDAQCCNPLTSGKTGSELYVTDGTASGTLRLTDATPNNPSNNCWWCYAPQEIRVLDNGIVARFNTESADVWYRSNGTLAGTANLDLDTNDMINVSSVTVTGGRAFYSGGSFLTGAEPWYTDGSPAGTVSMGDLNPATQSSGATEFVMFGSPSRVMFRASDGIHGEELWITDLTTAGTRMVKDINPTQVNSSNGYPTNMTRAGNKVYFRAYTPSAGWELWSSDGTEAGTTMIELATGTADASVDQLHGMTNGSLVFRFNNGVIGHEPWVTDGTSAGTRSLGDFNPNGNTEIRAAAKVGANQLIIAYTGDYWSLWSTDGTQSTPTRVTGRCENQGDPDVQELRPLANGVLMRMNDCVYGHRWWRSDGTVAGTQRLTPFDPQNPYHDVSLNPIGDRYFFTRNDATYGEELWTTDGSPTGTRVLVDINTSNISSNPQGGVRLGNKYVFAANDGVNGEEMWVTDGTPSGTMLLGNLNAGTEYSGNINPQSLTVAGSKVFFRMFSSAAGWELGVTDGTPSGTRVFDLTPGRPDSGIDQMFAAGDRLFFRKHGGSEGHEVWTSDGTEAGTHLLVDMNPGGGGVEFNRAGYAGGVYFLKVYTNVTPGWTLWATDGTSANTRRLTEPCANNGDANPEYFHWLPGGAVFALHDCVTGHHFWRSDGTVAGTVRLDPIANDGISVTSLQAMGNKVVYTAKDATVGNELWVSDGSAAGTMPIKDIATGTASSETTDMVVAGNNIFYVANDGVNGTELWVSDGTAAGSRMVKDITPSTRNNGNSQFSNMYAVGSKVLFRLYEGSHGWEVYASDGTAAGTERLTTYADDNNYLQDVTAIGNRAVFVFGNWNGRDTYVSDLTAAGTSQIDFNPGDDQIHSPIVVGGRMFARAYNSSSGWELFVSDGTVGGTRMIEIRAGSNGSDPDSFKAVGTGVVFSATTDLNRTWLYSNGTVAGTGQLDPDTSDANLPTTPLLVNGVALYTATTAAEGTEIWKWTGSSTPTLVEDGNPGPGHGVRNDQITDGSRLYYKGNNGTDGWEIFSSDGTAAGTGMLGDVNVGSADSDAAPLVVVGNYLIVNGNNGTTTGVNAIRLDTGTVTLISTQHCGAEAPMLAGSRAIMRVNVAGDGCELIATDGTVAGTEYLGDLRPGSSGAEARLRAVSGDKVYFTADDGAYGNEMWVTNGTAAGTSRLTDFAVGSLSTNFNQVRPFGTDNLLFDVCVCSAWRWAVTDGTAAGTSLLDPDPTDPHDVSGVETVGESVVFDVMESDSVREMWLWSGLTGTSRSLDLNPYSGSAPRNFVRFGSTLLFSADDGLDGRELWKTTGTIAGTTRVVDSNVTPRGSDPGILTIVDGTIYFMALDVAHGRELWKSNGTSAGTALVEDIRPGVQSTDVSFLGVLGSRILLNIVDGTHSQEPWISDGTAAGTTLLADTNPTTNSSGYGYVDQVIISRDGGRAFFRAYDGTERDMWSTDGTPSGTAKVLSVNNGDDNYESMLATDTKLFFRKHNGTNWYLHVADAPTSTTTQLMMLDGSRGADYLNEQKIIGRHMVFRLYNFPTNGCSWQYWITDGTVAGTRALDNDPTDAQCVTDGVVFGNRFAFIGDSGAGGREVIVIDGVTGTTTTLDANPTGSGNPDSLLLDGNGIRFRADDGVRGREWWTSDGTVAGTRIEADVATRAAGSSPSYLTVMNGITYFRALSAETGVELWRTDGTVAGTYLVKDMQPGNVASELEILGVKGTQLVLRSNVNGEWQLWVSDGTAAGTIRLRDFNASGNDETTQVTIAGNKVYFRANNGTTHDMWVSDGTTAGTTRVNFNAAGNDEWDSGLTLGDRLIYRAPTANDGRELFITDGTAAGTVYLGDVETGAGDIYFSNWSTVKVGNTMLFEVYRRPNNDYHAWQWWRTDGTLAGTRPFDMRTTDTEEVSDFALIGSTLYFTDDDGTGRKSYKLDGNTGAITLSPRGSSSSVTQLGSQQLWMVDDGVHGNEPWKVDSSGNFSLIRDVNASGATSDGQNFVVMGGVVYFLATDGTNGRELWKSDGVNPPSMVADVSTSENCCGSLIDNLTVVGNKLFLAIATSATRKELWTSDGTAAGTRLVKDINTDNGYCWWCYVSPDQFVELNGKLVFRAGQNNDREMWVSDGTSAGTVRLADINPNGNSDAESFVKVGNRLFFRALDSSNRRRLWVTDGTVSGTSFVKDINPNGDVSVGGFFAVGDNAVIEMYEPTYSWQRWFTDGTGAGTFLLDPYPTDSNWPDHMTAVGSKLLFNAPDLNNDRELWTVDANGQRSRLGDLNTSGSANPGPFTVIGSQVYFPQDTDEFGREMWVSDGTLAGTSLYRDINRVAAASQSESLAVAGSRIVFRHNAGQPWEGYRELGVGGGTTVTRVDLNPNGESNPQWLTSVGNKVVFSANDGTETQLWVTDGTAVGTQVLLDINPSGNDAVSDIVSMGGRVFFRANDGTNGVELWETDGTVAGTRRLTNINPNGDSSPEVLYVAGNRMFVAATDGTSGRELHTTSDGTNFVALGDNNTEGDHNPTAVMPVGSMFVYRGYDPLRGWEPWVTDGTVAGTRILADLNPQGDGDPQSLTVLSGSKVLFTANDGTNGREPWITDGTVNGTFILDIQTGPQNGGSSDPHWITVASGRAYMNAYNEARQRELWITDGTLVGTRQSDINLAGGLLWGSPAAAGSNIAWAANDGANGIELWLSNGTSAGTSQVEINPSRLRDDGNSYPGGFTAVGSTTYFTARNAVDGNELWKSDGTVAGTQLVRDINEGTMGGDPDVFGMAGGLFVFRSRSPEFGNELWVSDGNPANARLLKDIRVGTGDGNPDDFVMSGGRLFFRADDGQKGREVWVTDGSTAGTRMIKDIYPYNWDGGLDIDFAVGTGVVFRQNNGVNGWQHYFTNGTSAGTRLLDNNISAGDSPEHVRVVGDRVVYRLDDGVNGSELWSFDGNTGVRSLVSDINPGNGGSGIDNLWLAGDRVYFLANDGVHGRELWVSNGTAAGTRMVRDVTANGDLQADNYFVVGTRMFFRASDGTSHRNLWVTDGTTVGTYEVKDIYPNGDDHIGEAVGGTNTFYFRSYDGTNGWELWRSDGTSAGTNMVMNLNPTGDAWMDQFHTVGDKLFFRADDTVHGRESWVSDGTANGTFMLADVNTTSNNDRHSDNDWVQVGAGKYVFHPYDGTTRQFWISDGTVGGTRKLASNNPCPNTEAQNFVYSGTRVFFRVCDAVRGWEPWVSDGTANGTFMLADVNPGGDSSPEAMTALTSGYVAFRANDGLNGNEMWLSDGTAAGTRMAADTNSLGADSNPDRLTPVGNKLFFTADDGLHGRELWVADSAGVRMVADPNPGNGDANQIVAAGTTGVYYRYNDGVHGIELWFSDGTEAGTRMVKDMRPQTDGDLNGVSDVLGYANGKVFFRPGTNATGWELGVSDGTAAGTSLIEIRAGGNGGDIDNPVVVGDKIYFRSWSDNLPGRRLMASDGTLAGTVDVIPENVGDPNLGDTMAFGAQLAFVSKTSGGSRELWISDGTIAGTRVASSINATGSAEVSLMKVAGSRVYFSASSPTIGRELYSSDGTPNGVVAIDVNPSGNSYPEFLAVNGSTFYFVANDGVHGRELFATTGTLANTSMADINLAGGSRPFFGLVHNSTLFFAAHDGASGHEFWALTGGWTPPAVPNVTRTALAPVAPVPVVRTVPATVPPIPSTGAPVSTTEAPFETVAPIVTTPLPTDPSSTTPPSGGPDNTSPETTVPTSSPSGPVMVGTPANTTPNLSGDEQRRLEAPRGQATAMVNGVVVPVDLNRVSGTGITPNDRNRSPQVVSQIRTQARELVNLYNSFVAPGGQSSIEVVDTDRGASVVGLLVDPNNPTVSIPVPAEFVIVVTTPTGAMILAGLNNSGTPSVVSTAGSLQVTRGGHIGISLAGMPVSSLGQLIMMSTPKVIGEFSTTSQGTLSIQVGIPSSMSSGTHSLVVKSDWFAASFGIQVTPPVSLPATGTESETPTRYAALFVLVGVAVLVARRRWRSLV